MSIIGKGSNENWICRDPIPHNRPTLGKSEEKFAINILRSGWLAQGSAVETFEREFCEFLEIPEDCAVAVSSGTAALYLSLLVNGAKNRTVAYPAYTCSALRNAVGLVGGNHALVDSQSQSPNMNIEQVPKHASIAIIPHMYGIPQEIPYNLQQLLTIEDCAQSLGARVNEKYTGLQGDLGVFSFFATKLMTSGGQGGMIIAKDPAIIQEIKDYRLFDKRSDEKLRFNFQMTDLQAAIGIAQIRQFPSFIKRREEIYQQYKEAGLPLLDGPPNITPVRFRAIIQTTKQNELITALRLNNITSVIPLQEWELLGPKNMYTNAYHWTQNLVSLPIYPTLKDVEVKLILEITKNIL
ncbi:DegT/DnrJ/EryC1/StrS family aminotransferase [Ureibacillus manganicus]|uniref:Uncharacterized protein n=1 Tax=Ureibacillus manganicus DSM 26584 TaxID=1384049 RepID=A0A0A3I6J2_9BACL|nr:DegT/DnrJ/EryC1/StrS family aminotransferase [Ureibacillus manganicus]KGR78298.1 hypothetical protein CD29_11280 [Ureibacillus manganicus DSM 26584]